VSTVGQVYVGAVAPEAITIDITPSAALPDLSVVTAASIAVVRPDGDAATWSATITFQTAGALRITHVFASGNLPIRGTYSIAPVLTVPGGTRRCKPLVLNALPLP
jgi:hypothetical protein